MKNITIAIGLVLAFAASAAQAIPTLFFDGAIDYDSTSTELMVEASLTESVDITPAPTLLGSTMVFSAFFDSVESLSGSCFFCSDSTKGYFFGSTDASINDLEIIDGDGTTLLTAKFDSLSLEGIDGGDTGEIIGILSATGGSLISMFDGSDLFALQLNLSTVFSDTMYDSDFAGRVDGNIKARSVPEPSSLALLGLGILITGFARKTNILYNTRT